jgi:hypothetical protein
MIDTNPRREQHTTPNDAPARRSSSASSARRRCAASISDAVIAAYIHELRHAGVPKRSATRIVATDPLPD